MTTTLEQIPVDLVDPDPRNVRRNLGNLDELTESITAQGILQPLVVAPHLLESDGTRGPLPTSPRYTLIAGHRRHAAAQRAGLTHVPCLVRDDLTTPAQVVQAQLVENLHRSDLTVIEEAAAYQQLELLGVNTAAIAKATGRPRATVASRLRLMTLPEKARDRLDAGQLTLADADLLLKHADDTEIMAAAEGKSGRDLAWAIEHVQRERLWAAERAKRDAEKSKTAAKRKETAAEKAARMAREAEQYDRERRRRLAETSAALQKAWVLERIAAGDTALPEQVARLVLDELICDQQLSPEILHAVGFTPLGEDDDADDWWSAVQREARDLPAAKVHLILALDRAEILDGMSYWVSAVSIGERLERLIELCGYVPAAEERELLGHDEP